MLAVQQPYRVQVLGLVNKLHVLWSTPSRLESVWSIRTLCAEVIVVSKSPYCSMLLAVGGAYVPVLSHAG